MSEPETPEEIQQEYFENLPDCDWIRYEMSNRNHLRQNVAFAMFGSPSNEYDDILLGYTSRQKEQILKVYYKICEQSKFSHNRKDIVMSVILVVCAKPKPVPRFKFEPNDHWKNLHRKKNIDIWCVPVFRIRKCIPTKAAAKCCRIYIDDNGREYQNWNSYIKSNTNPKCVLVVPKNGFGNSHVIITKDVVIVPGNRGPIVDAGQINAQETLIARCRILCRHLSIVMRPIVMYINHEVQTSPPIVKRTRFRKPIPSALEKLVVEISIESSPALDFKADLISSADTVNTVATLGALALGGVACLTPVGPAVLTGIVVANVGTSIYSALRSTQHLCDRAAHGQSVSLSDSEARGSWINITTSGVGLAAGGATKLLSRSARTGSNLTKTGKVIAASVEVLRHSNSAMGGVGIVNSLFQIIIKKRDHDELSKLEILQFSVATLFFFRAVMTSKTAQSIIEDAQAHAINGYRSSLRSNRHRRIFDKVSAEVRRTQGTVHGNTEVIKGIKNIANKDQFFADVLKINKDVNQHKLRISLTSDGNVKLNAQHKFNPSDLRNLGKDGRSGVFSSVGQAPAGPNNVQTRIATPPINLGKYPTYEDKEQPKATVGINPEEVLMIGSLAVSVSSFGAEKINSMLENLREDIHENIMNVSVNVLSKLSSDNISKLIMVSPDEDLLFLVIEFVFNYLKKQRPSSHRHHDDGIQIVLDEFFHEGNIRDNKIVDVKDVLLRWVNTENRKRPKVFCSECRGVKCLK